MLKWWKDVKKMNDDDVFWRDVVWLTLSEKEWANNVDVHERSRQHVHSRPTEGEHGTVLLFVSEFKRDGPASLKDNKHLLSIS